MIGGSKSSCKGLKVRSTDISMGTFSAAKLLKEWLTPHHFKGVYTSKALKLHKFHLVLGLFALVQNLSGRPAVLKTEIHDIDMPEKTQPLLGTNLVQGFLGPPDYGQFSDDGLGIGQGPVFFNGGELMGNPEYFVPLLFNVDPNLVGPAHYDSRKLMGMGDGNEVSVPQMGFSKTVIVKVAVHVPGQGQKMPDAEECPAVGLGFHAVHPNLAGLAELHIFPQLPFRLRDLPDIDLGGGRDCYGFVDRHD